MGGGGEVSRMEGLLYNTSAILAEYLNTNTGADPGNLKGGALSSVQPHPLLGHPQF